MAAPSIVIAENAARVAAMTSNPNEFQLVRKFESDSNAYDRYWDEKNGAAMVYRHVNTIKGYANGIYFEREWNRTLGNIAAFRIRPEMGQWWVYIFGDPEDHWRAEYKVAVLDI